MGAQDWDAAAYKPDLTDKQLPSAKIRTSRLVVSDVTDSTPLASTPVFVRELRIKAERANKGIVYVGAEVSVDLRTNGYPLGAGEELPLPVNDLSIVYYQGDTVDDAIRIIWGQ